MATVTKAEAIQAIKATPNPVKPVRADYAELSDEDFAEVVEQYELQMKEIAEAAKGPDFGRNDEDAEHGPGVVNK